MGANCSVISSGHKLRSSSIELLKIVSLFLIVLSHTAQTLGSVDPYISFSDYLLDLSKATTDPQCFALSFIWSFGAIGNSLFFICSAWFLLDSDRVDFKKIIRLLISVLSISLLILGIMLIIRKGNIPVVLIVKSFFPTVFSNNWYITCYILFYLCHAGINKIIRGMTQRKLLATALLFAVLYLCMNYLYRGLLFGTELTTWLAVYFILAYIKSFMPRFADSLKANLVLMCVGLLVHFCMTLGTNLLGLKVAFFSDKLLHWSSNCSPFIIMFALGAFNAIRRGTLYNKAVNYIASLSLLIYIIHENILLRTYLRPAIFQAVYLGSGFNKILLWVFLIASAIFVASLFCAILFDLVSKRIISNIAEKLYLFLKRAYNSIEKLVFRIN